MTGAEQNDPQVELTDLRLALAQRERELKTALEEREEARSWARHGYEIGQRSTLWSDYGVAPKWLTEGWPPHFDADPVTKILTQLDEMLLNYQQKATQNGRCGSPMDGLGGHIYHCYLPAGHKGWHQAEGGVQWSRELDEERP